MRQGPIRRLRFAYHPSEDESLVGAFVAACREHRLVSVTSGLEGAGVRLSRPGGVQVAPSDILELLAFVMRTDAAALRRLALSTDERGSVVVGTDLVMPRGTFDWRTRRIGPTALRQKAYHRGAWLNMMLPYCPETLERLVAACPTCGPLGWRLTRGIANCEACGDEVLPSSEPGLPSGHAVHYRGFAALMAINAATSTAAIDSLPAPIRSISRTALVNVAIRAGTYLISGQTQLPESLFNADPMRLAGILSEGMRLLRGWPDTMCASFRERAAMMTGDLDSYAALRRALRWIRGAPGSEEARLVEMSLPNLDGRSAHPLAEMRNYYTAGEASARLGISCARLAGLRDGKALRYEVLPSRRRVRARYDADDVEELRTRLEDSMSIGSAAAYLDLPVYAIGQLVLSGCLVASSASGVTILRGRRIETSSLIAFGQALQAASERSGAPPLHFVKLRHLLARRPGEKPWGPVVQLMLNGSLPYRLPQRLSLREAYVDPTKLPRLGIPLRSISSDPVLIDHLSLRDAQEVLGTSHAKACRALADHRSLDAGPRRGDRINREALRSLVEAVAFSGEVASRNLWSTPYAFAYLSRLALPTVKGGWSRRALVDLNLVDAVIYDDH